MVPFASVTTTDRIAATFFPPLVLGFFLGCKSPVLPSAPFLLQKQFSVSSAKVSRQYPSTPTATPTPPPAGSTGGLVLALCAAEYFLSPENLKEGQAEWTVVLGSGLHTINGVMGRADGEDESSRAGQPQGQFRSLVSVKFAGGETAPFHPCSLGTEVGKGLLGRGMACG